MKDNNIYPTKGTSLYEFRKLKTILKDFSRECKITIGSRYYFYLQNKGRIIKEINKELRVIDTGICQGDKVRRTCQNVSG